MAFQKGKSEGGSGGRRGHSGMAHAFKTKEVKDSARRTRRLVDKLAVQEGEADRVGEAPPRAPKPDRST